VSADSFPALAANARRWQAGEAARWEAAAVDLKAQGSLDGARRCLEHARELRQADLASAIDRWWQEDLAEAEEARQRAIPRPTSIPLAAPTEWTRASRGAWV
jgi:hypothetical protein